MKIKAIGHLKRIYSFVNLKRFGDAFYLLASSGILTFNRLGIKTKRRKPKPGQFGDKV